MNAVLTDDEVGILLAAATHAPSPDNSQPWRFEVHGPVVDVLLDAHRVPAADPAGRAARIAIGAAAFNVRVAAAVLGHETSLAVNPDPVRPDVVARVFLGDRRTPVPELDRLYGEVSERHRYGGPLLDRPIPQEVREQLDAAARAEGARLHWLGVAPPAVTVLGTAEEDSTAWVAAGVALERVLLVATSYGLVASFLDEMLDGPARRSEVRKLIGGRDWPQAALRIGYPAGPVGHTARRDWRESLDQWF